MSPELVQIETFPANKKLTRLRISSSALSAWCPKRMEPDFYRVVVEYIPNELCIEYDSFRNFLIQFRDEKIFIEDLTVQLMDTFVRACRPKWLRVQLIEPDITTESEYKEGDE